MLNMAGRFNPEDYEPVEDRIRAFYADHPNGRITTTLVFQDEKRCIFSAMVYKTEEQRDPTATGYAEETQGSTPVNRTNAIENCETSAIGRALANAGYSPKGKRPSREEMQKSERASEVQRERVDWDPVEARKKLLDVCERHKFDKAKVLAAYERINRIDLRNDQDGGRINKFMVKLMGEPKAVLGEPEAAK